MKISLWQHVPFEGPGRIAPWCRENGHDLQRVRLYDGESPPAAHEYDMLIGMGGPMSVGDEQVHPWLKAEKLARAAAMAGGKTVLGICLGAQLLAEVLGGRVYANVHKEIGWFPITLTEAGRRSRLFGNGADTMLVFHWHGDTFELPPGCDHLAFSEACRQQAFCFKDQVVGLQFHLEVGPDDVHARSDNCRHELVEGPFIEKEPGVAGRAAWFHDINGWINNLLNQMQAP